MEYPTSEALIVLGFDARRPLEDDRDWTQDRRSQFLIRPEVRRPISVDEMVWPIVAEKPGDENPVNIWNSLSRLLKALSGLTSATAPAPVIIEIGVVIDEESSRYWRNVSNGYLRPEEDAGIELEAQELGYDVADRYLVSALSNCMPSEEELAGLRRDWSGSINPMGLFSKTDDAEGFRCICNSSIAEHAPFCVYRIRRLGIVADSQDSGRGVSGLSTLSSSLSGSPTPTKQE
jgi:hypothetical protein